VKVLSGGGPAPVAAYDVHRQEIVAVGAVRYERILIRTPWLGPGDDLGNAVLAAIGELCRPADTVFVAEKLAVLLTGRSVPAATIRAGRLARLLAAQVRPYGDSKGLSIPSKMQYVLDHTGPGRIAVAAAAAAATRPLGIRGTFYRLAGSLARDIDGMRPPYEGTLLPPLTAAVAVQLCERLASRIGAEVAIVDINDRGGSVRGRSLDALPESEILAALRDNPLGHCDQATPVGLLRLR